jgi:hypothetical protein
MRALCILACAAGVAHAAPVGQGTLDVDGDGKTESVELDADGALRVAGVKRASLAVKAAKASFSAAKTNTGTWLIVDAGEQALVINTKTWQVATTTPVGGVGLDREYSIAVAATPEGVFRYQQRADVKRCDGKPAYLFAERLDAKTPASPALGIPANAAVLAAKADPGAAAVPVIYQARAASHEAGVSDAGGLAIPRELDDGNPVTTWREDLAASSGEGQFFTFTPRIESARAQAIRIVAAPKSFNRPKGIAIVSATGAWRAELPDAAPGSAYVIELPQPIAGCVTVILESVHGKAAGTTAIAELEVFADGERSGGGGEALLAHVIAEGKGGEIAAAAALAKRGAAAVVAIDGELAKASDAATRRRLVSALAKVSDPAAAPVLVRAATAGWVRDQDLLDVIHALGATGQVAALKELAGKGGTPVAIRTEAAAQITPANRAGYDALVDLTGRGPREVRRAVIERLALAPAAQLAATAASQSDAAASGDVWRALTRRMRGHAEERAAAVAAMGAALAKAADYERRYRLVDGIAAYGDAAALRELERFLASLPTSPDSAALRQVAVRSIASSPRAEATTIVIALARDADPGVRLAALAALSNSETDAAGVWHLADGPDAIDRVIMNGLVVDTWPEVRRRAATALGARCQRPGPAEALRDAAAKDKSLDVRADALTALVQCKASGIRELLAKTWNDGKAPIDLRVRAVSLAEMLGDAELARSLVGKLNSWRGEAISSRAALELAQQAATTVGALNPPGAAEALVSALDDTAFPEIVAAASLGLAAMGKACPASARAKLNVIARSGSQAASAARHAAGRCGR